MAGVNFTPEKTATKVKVEDLVAAGEVAFEWAESLDTKNWVQLRGLLAPKLTIDYSAVLGPDALFTDMEPESFVESMVNRLGDASLATQHILGATKWTFVSDTEIVAQHQLTTLHRRFETEERKVVKATCDGAGKSVHHYTLIEGQWKLSGLKAIPFWIEPGLERVLG